eukprot:UN07977
MSAPKYNDQTFIIGDEWLLGNKHSLRSYAWSTELPYKYQLLRVDNNDNNN